MPNMDLSVSPKTLTETGEQRLERAPRPHLLSFPDIRAKKSRYRSTRYSLSSYSSTSAFFRAERKPWRKNEGLFYAHHRDGDSVALCEIGTVAGFAGMAQGQVLSGVRPYNCARNFYVDGMTGNDVSTSGSQSYPWKTI